MKVIIAGSRSITDFNILLDALDNINWRIKEVVSGTAKGVDSLGEQWAIKHIIDIKQFPANWEKFGRAAGYMRNKQMAEYADAAIILWDGKSKGTENMIQEMINIHKPFFVYFHVSIN